METKKEVAIRKAYGVNFEKYKVTENGYSSEDNSEFYSNIEWHPAINQLWRPFELKGLENNNGWIRIESEEDLPKDSDFYWIHVNGIILQVWFDTSSLYKDMWRNVTHYQSIVKPEKPIY